MYFVLSPEIVWYCKENYDTGIIFFVQSALGDRQSLGNYREAVLCFINISLISCLNQWWELIAVIKAGNHDYMSNFFQAIICVQVASDYSNTPHVVHQDAAHNQSQCIMRGVVGLNVKLTTLFVLTSECCSIDGSEGIFIVGSDNLLISVSTAIVVFLWCVMSSNLAFWNKIENRCVWQRK